MDGNNSLPDQAIGSQFLKIGGHSVSCDSVVIRETVTTQSGTFDRPTKVAANLRKTSTQGRGPTPPPLSSGQTLPTDDIGDLAEFNNGHLIALVLGGADTPENVMPTE